MLLQANDFLVLHQDHACDLQVAGSDQWGNITAGIDLIRRRTGDSVHGVTAPLIVRADGTKFGKSEGENIWLSPERTSPYRLYQYFLNVPDADVESLLLRLTLVDPAECRAVGESHMAAPERRDGQRRLAREITTLVHEAEVLDSIESAAAVLYGRPIDDADAKAFELLATELATTHIPKVELLDMDPPELFVRVGLAKSKGEVRRNPSGYYVNQVALSRRAEEDAHSIRNSELRHATFILLQRGKNAHHLVVAD